MERLEDRSVPSANPVSADTLVNAAKPGQQRAPDIAMSAAGNYVVVWEDHAVTSPGVYARLFSSSGSPTSGEIAVATGDQFDPGYNRKPSVAMDGAGNFVVAWETIGPSPDDTYDVAARLYTAAGIPLGGAFQVTGNGTNPSVARDGAGNFVVAWDAVTPPGAPNIFAQRYTAAGGALGSVFQVNENTLVDPDPDTPRSCSYPSVAMDGGTIVVAWTVAFSDEMPTEPLLVVARAFTNGLGSGTPAGTAEFFVNNPYTLYPNAGPYPIGQTDTSVAISNDGQTYVIAYAQHSVAINLFDPIDPYGMNVWARVYEMSGATTGPTTAAFIANDTLLGNQYSPDVAMDAVGNFVVTWVSSPHGGTVFVPPDPPQDGSGAGVFARTFRYDAATNTLTMGTEIQVHQGATNDQNFPVVALSDSGHLAFAWQSWNQFDTDEDGFPDSEWDVFTRAFSVTFP